MREDHYWPDWDTDQETDVERTAYVPIVVDDDLDLAEARQDDEEPVEPDFADELLDGHDIIAWPATRSRKLRTGIGRVLLGVGGLLTLLVLIYTADLMVSAGDVPRGVTVAGVEVGGLTHSDAEAKLRSELEPRLTAPVPVRAGDVRAELDPVASGLGLDWPATLERAGNQPLNPITRVLSFFTTREVGIVTSTNQDTLKQSITKLAETQLNHEPTEGSIRFETQPGDEGAVRAFAVEPRQGQRLADVDGAVEIIKAGWLNKGGVEFPMNITAVTATSAGVHAALDQIVNPMVAEAVVVHGEGKDATLKPADIAESLEFSPAEGGALQVKVDQSALKGALEPQLAETQREPKNAAIVFDAARPSVRPSEQGRTVNWKKTFQPFVEVAKQPEGRELDAVYDLEDPETTTEEAGALGITEVIGQFTTRGVSGGVATNVAAIAGEVNGAIVKPGETFNLDGHTGPRTASQGYVMAPVREDGTGPSVLGGGVSQFTTTLYNAVYFAGLRNAGHTAHTYYLDRYPPARDARSLAPDGSSIPMAFTNDAPTGVAIQAFSSGDSVTVKIWGTKRYRVESSTGSRTDIVEPPVESGPEEGCEPTEDEQGFTTSDTRVLYDIESGEEVRRDTTTATYQPRPRVTCD